MAYFQIIPLEQSNFSQPNEWPKWIYHFESFHDASRLSKKDEVHQVIALVYCMGNAVDDILYLLDFSSDDKKVYVTVKVRNLIFGSAKFNQRRQKGGKSINSISLIKVVAN